MPRSKNDEPPTPHLTSPGYYSSTKNTTIQAHQLKAANTFDDPRHHSSPMAMNDFAAWQNSRTQEALYSHDYDFFTDAAAPRNQGNAIAETYVCHPCDKGAGSGGIQFDNDYNVFFPPIQGRIARNNHGHRSNNHHDNRGPIIAAGDGGERPSPPPQGHVTPQNLRDNPERLAKVKTEMCLYIDENGSFKNCPYGAECG